MAGMQTDIIHRLSGGAQSGRAAAAEKALEKMKSEGELVRRPFVAKKRSFAFPPVERMGQVNRAQPYSQLQESSSVPDTK